MGQNTAARYGMVPALSRANLVARQDSHPAADAPPPAAAIANRVPPLGRVPRWEKGLLVDYYT